MDLNKNDLPPEFTCRWDIEKMLKITNLIISGLKIKAMAKKSRSIEIFVILA
ncbi:MAG: hypothetical protein GYA36_03045 [Veillonellaceae bacterium]|nr:hypothetical protein [Veillonellaceae bacterium]